MPENPRAQIDYMDVRPHMLDTIDTYIRIGQPTGDFLEAVLSNDLKDAVGRADAGNLATLGAIVKYVVNHTPWYSQGSRKKVKTWLDAFKARAGEIHPCKSCRGCGFVEAGRFTCAECNGLGTKDKKHWPAIIAADIALAAREQEWRATE